MSNIIRMLEKERAIVASLLFVLFSCPAMALDSGLTSDQSAMVIVGAVFLAVLIGLIGFERLLGAVLVLGGLGISLILTMLFFPLSLFFVVPIALGGCFWGFHHWGRPTVVCQSSNTITQSQSWTSVYSPTINVSHIHPAPEREVVYVPIPYETPAILPPSSPVPALPDRKRGGSASRLNSTLICDVGTREESRLTFDD